MQRYAMHRTQAASCTHTSSHGRGALYQTKYTTEGTHVLYKHPNDVTCTGATYHHPDQALGWLHAGYPC